MVGQIPIWFSQLHFRIYLAYVILFIQHKLRLNIHKYILPYIDTHINISKGRNTFKTKVSINTNVTSIYYKANYLNRRTILQPYTQSGIFFHHESVDIIENINNDIREITFRKLFIHLTLNYIFFS